MKQALFLQPLCIFLSFPWSCFVLEEHYMYPGMYSHLYISPERFLPMFETEGHKLPQAMVFNTTLIE